MNQLVSSTDSSTGVTTTYTYDTYGNLVNDGEYIYTYDNYFNRLYSVRNIETNESVYYEYYVDGLRKSKGNTYFIWHNGNMVYEFTSDDSNTYTYGHRLLYSDDYKYVLNAHGDVVALLNSDGETVKEYDYDAFGNELNPSESDTNPFRYCAEYFDIESGQIYLRARYYQPIVGRFSQRDTHWNTANMIYGDEVKTKEYKDYLGLNTYTVKLVDYAAVRQSGNLYVYCLNNPIFYIDTTGEDIATTIFNTSLGVGSGFALADGPIPFGDVVGVGIAAVGSLVAGGFYIAESISEYKAKARENTISVAISNIKENNPNDIIIYRTGSGNATKLTPRESDSTGLSYTTTMPTSGSFTITSINVINATGVLTAVNDYGTHVSVKPVESSKMQEWIDSRSTALINPHEYTKLLQSLSVKVK